MMFLNPEPLAVRVLALMRMLAAVALVATTSAVSRADWHSGSEGPLAWAHAARVAEAEFYLGIEETEIEAILSDLADRGANIIAAESAFYLYMSDERFEAELATVRSVTQIAHRRGFRIVWTYPVLEVISPKARSVGTSIFADHPDWVQRGIDGSPNVVFLRDSAESPEPDTEVAWMTLESPYGDYFIDRVRKISATGIDGLRLTALQLNGIQVEWTDSNSYSAAAFRAASGHDAPSKVDWQDPVWRQWVAWRRTQIAHFIERIAAAAKSESDDIALIIQDNAIDTGAATWLGVDAGRIREVPDLLHLSEIEPLSENQAIAPATRDDWVAIVGMNKYAKGVAGRKPSWTSFSGDSTGAGLLMAEALATGNRPLLLPLESATPPSDEEIQGTFQWIKLHAGRLFESVSSARVAVLFSAESRDYSDRGLAHGLYATVRENDPQWWTNYAGDSFRQMDYMGEYRGILKWLLDEHIPFEILVDPTIGELQAFDAVIAPSLSAISDRAADRLSKYVYDGGLLTITGPNPTRFDENGIARKSLALGDVLGIRGATVTNWRSRNTFGAGRVLHYGDLRGKWYLLEEDLQVALTLAANLPSGVRVVSTDAGPSVRFDLRTTPDETLVHVINGPGADGTAGIQPTRLSVSVPVQEGRHVDSVELSEPGTKPESRLLQWRVDGGHIHLEIQIARYALVIVSYVDSSPVIANDLPVSVDDLFAATAGVSFKFSAADLLRNDGDLDGDRLRVTEIVPTQTSVGRVIETSVGEYLYSPPDRLVERDIFHYAIMDERGGIGVATVAFSVGKPVFQYAPMWAASMKGRPSSGTFKSLDRTDRDTFDIEATAEEGAATTELVTGTWIRDPVDRIDKLMITVVGQFSTVGVEQSIGLYNFAESRWDTFDTRQMGIDDDVSVSVEVVENLARYVSSDAELRVRVVGRHDDTRFAAWANQVRWDVVLSP